MNGQTPRNSPSSQRARHAGQQAAQHIPQHVGRLTDRLTDPLTDQHADQRADQHAGQHPCRPTSSRIRRVGQRLNVWLYRHGVRTALLRRTIRVQVASATLLVVAGLGLWPVSGWIFWCGIGAWLSVLNFFSLTKQAPQFMLKKYGPSSGIALFVQTQGRIILTVGVGVVCAVWLRAPIGALLTGLSMSMIAIVWTVCALRRKAA